MIRTSSEDYIESDHGHPPIQADAITINQSMLTRSCLLHDNAPSLGKGFSFAGLINVSAFLGQENNKLYFFFHALIAFYEQANSRTS